MSLNLTAEPIDLPSQIAIHTIQRVVAQSYDIDPREMKSSRRGSTVSWPRQVAMYLTRELTPHSLPNIGRYFGNRDHTTVIHAIRKVESKMADDRYVKADVMALREALAP